MAIRIEFTYPSLRLQIISLLKRVFKKLLSKNNYMIESLQWTNIVGKHRELMVLM